MVVYIISTFLLPFLFFSIVLFSGECPKSIRYEYVKSIKLGLFCLFVFIFLWFGLPVVYFHWFLVSSLSVHLILFL